MLRHRDISEGKSRPLDLNTGVQVASQLASYHVDTNTRDLDLVNLHDVLAKVIKTP